MKVAAFACHQVPKKGNPSFLIQTPLSRQVFSMQPGRWPLSEIQLRLRSDKPRTRAIAALMLCHQPDDVPILFDELVNAIDGVPSTTETLTQSELSIFQFGSMAICNFLRQSSASSSDTHAMEGALSRLIQSSNEAIAASVVHHVGDLGSKGAFAWKELSHLVHRAEGQGASKRITLRAIAFRALTKIDFQRALALGDIPARSELENALERWISEPHSEMTKAELQAELEKLQR